MKYRLVHAFQKYLLNPPLKLAFRARAPAARLCAAGDDRAHHRAARARRPSATDAIGDTLWIVAEHGSRAGLRAQHRAQPPRAGAGRATACAPGGAAARPRVLPDDDPRERQRTLSRGRPGPRTQRPDGADHGHGAAHGPDRPRPPGEGSAPG